MTKEEFDNIVEHEYIDEPGDKHDYYFLPSYSKDYHDLIYMLIRKKHIKEIENIITESIKERILNKLL